MTPEGPRTPELPDILPDTELPSGVDWRAFMMPKRARRRRVGPLGLLRPDAPAAGSRASASGASDARRPAVADDLDVVKRAKGR